MNLKERLLKRQDILLGAFLGIPSPQLTEMLGLAGYDFAILDMEHGSFGRESLEQCLRAGAAVGLPCIVRVGALDGSLIQSALDMGAEGIQVPQVDDAEAAEGAVRFARFPPQGVRGYGSTTRAAAFGFRSRSTVREKAGRDLIISLQIESRQGVDNLDEILSVPGVDVIFIGTSDLSLSYGFDTPNHSKIVSLVEAIIPRIKKAAKTAGIFLSDWEQIENLKKLGVNYFTIAGAGLIKSAFQNQVESFQNQRRNLKTGE